jgi:hypothetical protein
MLIGPGDVIVPYLNFWNFSDPIVEVNAVVRHFRQPWVLMRKIWQYMCENLKILENKTKTGAKRCVF